MEHTPPPFFNTGPSPLTRLLIFSVLSLALLIADARYKHLDAIRQVAAVAIYPLQRIAAAPASLLSRLGEFFTTHSALRAESARLAQENLASATLTQKTRALEAENASLRKLLEAREQQQTRNTLAQVLYAARDPFTQRMTTQLPSIAEYGAFWSQQIAAGFREFSAHAAGCRFQDCRHLAEPGCAVRASGVSPFAWMRNWCSRWNRIPTSVSPGRPKGAWASDRRGSIPAVQYSRNRPSLPQLVARLSMPPQAGSLASFGRCEEFDDCRHQSRSKDV